MQFQSDLLGVTIQRPVVQETTALGAAYLAGLAVGFWQDETDVARNWALDQEFRPAMERDAADKLQRRWKDAVQRSLDWET
jgi:glycerol kinase